MSLKTTFSEAIPMMTKQAVEGLLSEDSIYRFVGEHISELLNDEMFRSMYAVEGRSGVNPVILGLVTVFQFLEKLSDRQAARMAVLRLDWKYALRQELSWTGFHYSDLCNFRKRLLEHHKEKQIFESIVGYLRDAGYVKGGGEQRTDSTHILGAVRDLSTIDLVRDTIHVALQALISTDAPWTLKYLPASFVQNYAPRQRYEWYNKAEISLALETAAILHQWRLAQVKQFGDERLQDLHQVKLLRRVLNEQFAKDKQTRSYTPTGHYRGNFIATPYDIEAHRSVKRSTFWVGYKCHVTESIAPTAEGRFITDMLLTASPDPDNQHVDTIQQRLASRQLLPTRQYVDQGYMSASNVAHSQTNGVNLRGRLLPDTSGKTPGFRLTDFQVDIANQRVICPDGKQALRFVPSPPNPRNLIAYHAFFGKLCISCRFFGPGLCTTRPSGRHLGISLYHDLIQTRRRDEQTNAFKREMAIRVGIENVISELVRCHGLRQARYRGFLKNQLQAYFIGACTNLKRLARVFCHLFLSSLSHTDFRSLTAA